MADPTPPNPATAAAAAATEKPAFDPAGKTFLQRLDAFLADAKATYSVTVRKDSGRSAEWEQKHHIAHMFAYNAYPASVKPANVDTENGHTISWDYFSGPTVVWAPNVRGDFLRTKDGVPPLQDGNAWAKGKEPDKEKTLANVKAMLVAAKIGDGGAAMVACGFSPCTEPCKCPVGRSKHLTEQAADLSIPDIESLTAKLKAAKGPDIDAYLKSFGLSRPLKNAAKSPEPWHVESE